VFRWEGRSILHLEKKTVLRSQSHHSRHCPAGLAPAHAPLRRIPGRKRGVGREAAGSENRIHDCA